MVGIRHGVGLEGGVCLMRMFDERRVMVLIFIFGVIHGYGMLLFVIDFGGCFIYRKIGG